jgi:hypothetical protein
MFSPAGHFSSSTSGTQVHAVVLLSRLQQATFFGFLHVLSQVAFFMGEPTGHFSPKSSEHRSFSFSFSGSQQVSADSPHSDWIPSSSAGHSGTWFWLGHLLFSTVPQVHVLLSVVWQQGTCSVGLHGSLGEQGSFAVMSPLVVPLQAPLLVTAEQTLLIQQAILFSDLH